jgi:hypothetical protein
MDKQKDIIKDEDDLYRRIPVDEWYVEKEDRVSSAAFTHVKASVNWAPHTTPEKTVAGFPNNHVAALQAMFPRAKDQEVKHDPYPDTYPDNYSHSLIIGKKSLSIRRYLAQKCRFVFKCT